VEPRHILRFLFARGVTAILLAGGLGVEDDEDDQGGLGVEDEEDDQGGLGVEDDEDDQGGLGVEKDEDDHHKII